MLEDKINRRLSFAAVAILAMQLLLWTNLRRVQERHQQELLQAVDSAREGIVHAQVAIANGHIHKVSDLGRPEHVYFTGQDTPRRRIARPMLLHTDDAMEHAQVLPKPYAPAAITMPRYD